MITYTLMKMALRMLFPCIMRICIKIQTPRNMIQNLERKASDNSRRFLLTHSMTVKIHIWRVKLRLTKLQKPSKKRKAPGYDNILNEHILHGGPYYK